MWIFNLFKVKTLLKSCSLCNEFWIFWQGKCIFQINNNKKGITFIPFFYKNVHCNNELGACLAEVSICPTDTLKKGNKKHWIWITETIFLLCMRAAAFPFHVICAALQKLRRFSLQAGVTIYMPAVVASWHSEGENEIADGDEQVDVKMNKSRHTAPRVDTAYNVAREQSMRLSMRRVCWKVNCWSPPQDVSADCWLCLAIHSSWTDQSIYGAYMRRLSSCISCVLSSCCRSLKSDDFDWLTGGGETKRSWGSSTLAETFHVQRERARLNWKGSFCSLHLQSVYVRESRAQRANIVSFATGLVELLAGTLPHFLWA